MKINFVINISIIEDSEIHREWLIAKLKGNPQFNIVSVETNGRQGIHTLACLAG